MKKSLFAFLLLFNSTLLFAWTAQQEKDFGSLEPSIHYSADDILAHYKSLSDSDAESARYISSYDTLEYVDHQNDHEIYRLKMMFGDAKNTHIERTCKVDFEVKDSEAKFGKIKIEQCE